LDLSFLDFSIFLSVNAWISLITLIFLECVLGIDNLVFITITTDRLPPEKQHIGRRLGLAGALVMRVAFLCVASALVQLTSPLFTVELGFFSHGFSVRDLILLVGGAYLVYKGIIELRAVLGLEEIKAEDGGEEHQKARKIGLGQAVGTIMVMDVVFSIDSVITAVGLSGQIIIMVIAVMVAVFIMIVFIDAISGFINKHVEMKILALTFIAVIGVLLVLDSLGLHTDIELLDMHVEKLMVYFAMLFAVILELIQMRFNTNLATYQQQKLEKHVGKSSTTVENSAAPEDKALEETMGAFEDETTAELAPSAINKDAPDKEA
jgi:predicted tellurium resistance membrane protein TerC